VKWAFRIAFVALILAQGCSIWLLRQPHRFAFRIIEPGDPGTKCLVIIHPDHTRATWGCSAPDPAQPTDYWMEEIPWPTH